jgi:hypothetical protein
MEIGFAEAPARVVEYGNERQMNKPLLLLLLSFAFPCWSLLSPSPFLPMFYSPIKKGRENFWVISVF